MEDQYFLAFAHFVRIYFTLFLYFFFSENFDDDSEEMGEVNFKR